MVLRVHVELLDGTPDGSRRAVVHQRQARAVAIPHAQMARMAEFPELSRPGVYFLLGSLRAGPTVYVGQTDSLQDRLRTHYQRAQWRELIAATSDGDWLNIAHARVLEAWCYQRCLQSRYFILNSQVPKESQISGHDRQDVEEFMAHLVILTQCLGYDFLLSEPDAAKLGLNPVAPALMAKTHLKPSNPSIQDIFLPGPEAPPAPAKHKRSSHSSAPPVEFPIVCTNKRNQQATMHAWPGRYVVKAGSVLREPSASANIHNTDMLEHRERLVRSGQLEQRGQILQVANDVTFKSPSAASTFAVGSASNGWVDWIDQKGRPLQQFRKILE